MKQEWHVRVSAYDTVGEGVIEAESEDEAVHTVLREIVGLQIGVHPLSECEARGDTPAAADPDWPVATVGVGIQGGIEI